MGAPPDQRRGRRCTDGPPSSLGTRRTVGATPCGCHPPHQTRVRVPSPPPGGVKLIWGGGGEGVPLPGVTGVETGGVSRVGTPTRGVEWLGERNCHFLGVLGMSLCPPRPVPLFPGKRGQSRAGLGREPPAPGHPAAAPRVAGGASPALGGTWGPSRGPAGGPPHPGRDLAPTQSYPPPPPPPASGISVGREVFAWVANSFLIREAGRAGASPGDGGSLGRGVEVVVVVGGWESLSGG